MSIQLEIPDSVSQALRLPQSEQSLRLKTELALALYGQGILSFGHERKLCGLGKLEFGLVRGRRNLPRRYVASDLQDDDGVYVNLPLETSMSRHAHVYPCLNTRFPILACPSAINSYVPPETPRRSCARCATCWSSIGSRKSKASSSADNGTCIATTRSGLLLRNFSRRRATSLRASSALSSSAWGSRTFPLLLIVHLPLAA